MSTFSSSFVLINLHKHARRIGSLSSVTLLPVDIGHGATHLARLSDGRLVIKSIWVGMSCWVFTGGAWGLFFLLSKSSRQSPCFLSCIIGFSVCVLLLSATVDVHDVYELMRREFYQS